MPASKFEVNDPNQYLAGLNSYHEYGKMFTQAFPLDRVTDATFYPGLKRLWVHCPDPKLSHNNMRKDCIMRE